MVPFFPYHFESKNPPRSFPKPLPTIPTNGFRSNRHGSRWRRATSSRRIATLTRGRSWMFLVSHMKLKVTSVPLKNASGPSFFYMSYSRYRKKRLGGVDHAFFFEQKNRPKTKSCGIFFGTFKMNGIFILGLCFFCW